MAASVKSSPTVAKSRLPDHASRRWTRLFWLGVMVSSGVLVLAGLWLSTQPAVVYNEVWCDTMLEVPHIDWQESDFVAFSEHCLNPATDIPSAPSHQ